MTFEEAVEKTPCLKGFWRVGLQALRAEDKPHVVAEDTRRFRGSVDIDKATQAAEPNANRWDFGIAYQHSNRDEEVVYWVELHTASDSEVRVVIRKAQWLLDWFKKGGARLAKFEKEILWVSSGATTFTLSATQRKQMALVGMRHVGGKLTIGNKR